jgi:hypothetical protein
VVQVAERLPSKYEAMNSNPALQKKKKKKSPAAGQGQVASAA